MVAALATHTPWNGDETPPPDDSWNGDDSWDGNDAPPAPIDWDFQDGHPRTEVPSYANGQPYRANYDKPNRIFTCDDDDFGKRCVAQCPDLCPKSCSISCSYCETTCSTFSRAGSH